MFENGEKTKAQLKEGAQKQGAFFIQMITHGSLILAFAMALNASGIIPLDSWLWATKADLKDLGQEVAANSSERLNNDVIRKTIKRDRLQREIDSGTADPDDQKKREILDLNREISEDYGLYCESQIKIHGREGAPRECVPD